MDYNEFFRALKKQGIIITIRGKGKEAVELRNPTTGKRTYINNHGKQEVRKRLEHKVKK